MAEVTPTELISFSDRPRTEQIGALTVRLFKPWFYIAGQKVSPFCPTFLKALRDSDVIHVYQFHTLTASLAILFGKLRIKKTFVTDLGGGGWDLFSYHGISERFVDGFIHLSEYAKDLSSVKNKKHYVAYGSVDTKKFYPLDLVRENRVLFVGRLLPHKGIDYLIQAVDATTSLTLIGRPYLQEYFEYLKQLAVGKNVQFILDADDGVLLREYNRARMLVLPSVYTTIYGNHSTASELLGLTVLEAMACKTPVVVTDVGALPELVKNGETGFVVNPNDVSALREKINFLLNHPDDVVSMGENAHKYFMERFQSVDLVHRVLDAYRNHLQ
jgi:glycosyltransferase involved in cell wall biosynthesis